MKLERGKETQCVFVNLVFEKEEMATNHNSLQALTSTVYMVQNKRTVQNKSESRSQKNYSSLFEGLILLDVVQAFAGHPLRQGFLGKRRMAG